MHSILRGEDFKDHLRQGIILYFRLCFFREIKFYFRRCFLERIKHVNRLCLIRGIRHERRLYFFQGIRLFFALFVSVSFRKA